MGGALYKLDSRFRQVPTFGRDSIRRFSSHVSELKKLAARDYENLLQCSISAFGGLFPEPYNQQILKLLFTLAHWHALAKLRQHTDLSLDLLEATTALLGKAFHDFEEKTCPAFNTRELKREAEARQRRQVKTSFPTSAAIRPTANANISSPLNPTSAIPRAVRNLSITGTTSASPLLSTLPPSPPAEPASSPVPITSTATKPIKHSDKKVKSQQKMTAFDKLVGRRQKTFNRRTYTNHSLGDYVRTIRMLGTTDSYSMEGPELEHRTPKSRYTRTSRKGFEKQLAKIERVQTRVRRIRQKVSKAQKSAIRPDQDAVPESSSVKYHIGNAQNNPIYLGSFLHEYRADPAVQSFAVKLRAHLLPRVQCCLPDHATTLHLDSRSGQSHVQISDTSTELNFLIIKDNRIYNHKLARFYYTTYDVRRCEDIINPRTSHCDVMLLASREGVEAPPHPFLYARVLGIFHTNIVYNGPGMISYEPMRFDFLWVRWFQLSGRADGRQLDRLTFLPMADENAFGFVDPAFVLRACHLLPSFLKGNDTKMALSCQGAQGMGRNGEPISLIGKFADRDMLMRYHWGLGIGHAYAQEAKFQPNPAIPDCEVDGANMLDDEESADAQPVTLGRDLDFENDDKDNPELGMGIRDEDEDEDEFRGQSGSDSESED